MKRKKIRQKGKLRLSKYFQKLSEGERLVREISGEKIRKLEGMIPPSFLNTIKN